MSRRTLALVLATLAVGAICVRLAWLGDDAYITLRSVENWVRGNGLRWNVADRALINTHPLWTLMLAAGRWLTGEAYFTTITISLALAGGAIFWLLRRADSVTGIVLVAILLATARGFCEYATSGLEPPLASLLLVAFVVVGEREQRDERHFLRIAALASLLALARLDLAVLAAPAVLAAMRGVPWRRLLAHGLIAASPLLAWAACAWLYFGSPLPVTAHAKAFGLGIPATAMAAQGLYYLWHTLLHDPVLVLVAAAGITLGLRDRNTRWLALGALLYVAYVVKVGGDFMAGRFLVLPFAAGIAILAPRLATVRPLTAAALGIGALVLACLPGAPHWLRAPTGDVAPPAESIEAHRGVVDERCMHYARLGLLSPGRDVPRWGALHELVWPEGRERRWFLLNGSVGVAGYQMGERGHLVDPLLCDPLLTRLPARNAQRWRIGHVLRRIPEGYYETLASGENRLRHPGLRAYYDALRTVTQAPVFARDRWAAMWRLASGELDAGLRAFLAEHYHQAPRVPVAATALPPEVPLGTYWFDELRLQLVYDGGLAVQLPAPRRARSLRVQTMGLVAFRFRFVRNGEVLGEAMGKPSPQPPHVVGLRAAAGLRAEVVDVPAGVGEFDALWVDAVETPQTHMATGPPALGAITFAD